MAVSPDWLFKWRFHRGNSSGARECRCPERFGAGIYPAAPVLATEISLWSGRLACILKTLMRLVRVAILLSLAAFLAAEPVLHTHPLIPRPWGSDTNGVTNPNLCAICAVGADRVVMRAPVVVAPQIVIEHLTITSLQPPSAEVRVLGASRAPPAA